MAETENLSEMDMQLKLQVEKLKDSELAIALSESPSRLETTLSMYNQLIDNQNYAVINVYGPPRSGRSWIAEKIAYKYHLEQERIPQVSFDYYRAYNQISSRSVLIVKQGSVESKGKDNTDDYGAEQYQNFASKRNGIVIIISTKPIQDYMTFSFRALGFHDRNSEKFSKALLEIDMKLGVIYFSDIPNTSFKLRIDKITNDAREEYFKSEIDLILDNIKETTKDLIKSVIIDPSIIFMKDEIEFYDNAIIPKFMLTLGGQGTGKTTFSYMWYQLFQSFYRKQHVHARSHKDDLGILLQEGFSSNQDKFCQYLVVQDGTHKIQDDSELFFDWVNIRHIMNERTGGTEEDKSTGLQQGIVITQLNFHEFEGSACPKAVRQKIDVMCFFDIPTNNHDYHVVRNFLKKKDGVMFEFLEYISAKQSIAEREVNTEELEYWKGFGVAKTKNGLIPFRMNTDTFNKEYIPFLHKHSTWRKTWIDIADTLSPRFYKLEKKPSNFAIDAAISQYEIENFGRLRPNTELRINYRKHCRDRIKSNYEMHKSQVFIQNNDQQQQQQSKPELKVSEHFKLIQFSIDKDTKFLYLMLNNIPESRHGVSFSSGYDDFIRSRTVIRYYITGSQRDAADLEQGSASSVSNWTRKYKSKYQGYDAEAALLERLGEGWETAGSNSEGADLYHNADKKLISLKCYAASKFTDKLDRIGKKELEMIADGWEGELWVYAAIKHTWYKYKIVLLEEEG